ncbi:uncharacterized protein [Elaeis guineensis]|uniref:Uncharacterized protein LOC105034519 isoform X1 n=1 Tax=Elaeis guineensis var. tenera TaxID=51953 RepID=A0A6I9QFX3_ELAGV|nr:uncharacterized protein LOC105034519 isoform X1 [Elaeis guineensis]
MALAAFLYPHRIAPLLPPFPYPRRRRRVLFPLAVVRATAEVRQREAVREARNGAAVVWFKRDLRTDDHPGLVAAVSQHQTVVPLYVFDRRILSNFSDEMLKLLLLALEDLKQLLKDQGSDLLVAFGSAEDVIRKLVNEVKASYIFAEEEVEYNSRSVMSLVKSSVSSVSFAWGSPEFVFWRTPFYNVENLEELPASYRDFLQLQLSQTIPVAAPTLPVLEMEVDRGALPTFDDIKMYLLGEPCQSDNCWTSLKKVSAETILRKEGISQAVMKSDPSESLKSNEGKNIISSTLNNVKSTKIAKSVFASGEGTQVGGGTNNALNALAAYLRYLEGTARDDWQELHEKLRKAECRKGASFGALFGSALYLGTISRRRVYYEAIKYERERNAGYVSPFGYSTPTVAAAVDAVHSMEWYWLLALKCQKCNEGIYPIRIWSWNGYLIQYTAVGHEGPAVLFVHGFGAFLEHFRDNISSIADGGRRVWAITLLGFGKSEKPNILYTKLMWAELLRDFIIDVVGEPVHLVGNSIGGYFVSIVAGLWPALARSLVLLNTAGSIVPSYSSIPLVEEGQTSGLAWLQARLLLLYLRLRAGSILKKCYPTNAERADDGLIGDILRASYDPGVPIILESILNFDLSIPLNYLFDSFGGKILVVQGMKDPLSKSKLFLSMLREHCIRVTVSELDAGHCPHDELPVEVNSILSEWTSTAESCTNAIKGAKSF